MSLRKSVSICERKYDFEMLLIMLRFKSLKSQESSAPNQFFRDEKVEVRKVMNVKLQVGWKQRNRGSLW